MITTPDAVFFDMDGVLYDSMKNHEYTWVESFKSVGINFLPEQAYLNEGRTGYSTIRLFYNISLGREATLEECEAVYLEKTRLMSLQPQAPVLQGMQELVFTLRQKGVKVLVVTGSQQPALLGKLNRDFGFQADEIVSGHDVKHGKPHPEPYLMAVEKSGTETGRCVVVENAPLGIQSARAAGIYTIAVNTGILSDDVLWNEGCQELFPDTVSLSNQWLEALNG